MAYEKNNWQSGDVVTSDKLNRMEDGIAGGTLVIGGFSYDDRGDFVGTSDKTWQEIDSALAAGTRCVVIGALNGGHIQMAIDKTEEGELYYSIFLVDGSTAITTSADGYPAVDNSFN